MKKITISEVKQIAKDYSLKPCRIKGSEVVQIRKNPSDKYEDISWVEFEEALNKKNLAVYKASESDFLKIMKDQ